MAKLVSIDVNLVPKDPFFNTYLGKLLRWALSVGRYIVIFTELIVILSFVTRFSIDRQITDLNDSIFQKQTVIESFGDLETQIRTTQKKIEHFLQIEQQTNIVDIFPALSEITPRSISMDQVIIRPTNISLSGKAVSQQGLNTLISNIQLSPTFTNVNVGKIATDQESGQGFEFTISADIAQ